METFSIQTCRQQFPLRPPADRAATGYRPAHMGEQFVIDTEDGEWLTYSQAAKVLGLSSPVGLAVISDRYEVGRP
jgi:hypothetical protein